MATELWAAKIVHNDIEHQYWIDRTIPMASMYKKVCPIDWNPKVYANLTSLRMWNSIWNSNGWNSGKQILFPKNNVHWDGCIHYYPNSRILSWGGWSIHGQRDLNIERAYYKLNGKNYLNRRTNNNRNKTDLKNVLRTFSNVGGGKTEFLRHFDEHSYWYWDSCDEPFTENQQFGTYNSITKTIETHE